MKCEFYIQHVHAATFRLKKNAALSDIEKLIRKVPAWNAMLDSGVFVLEWVLKEKSVTAKLYQ